MDRKDFAWAGGKRNGDDSNCAPDVYPRVSCDELSRKLSPLFHQFLSCYSVYFVCRRICFDINRDYFYNNIKR